MIASKCSWDHVISEKYKTVPSFKIHFPLCNCEFLPATVKELETFLEAICWKPFQLFRHIITDVNSITKAPSIQSWFQSREQLKISCCQVRRIGVLLQCCHSVICQEILYQNRTVCRAIVVMEKSTVGSPFFGAFPSDRIPKMTKDVNLHFFHHTAIL